MAVTVFFIARESLLAFPTTPTATVHFPYIYLNKQWFAIRFTYTTAAICERARIKLSSQNAKYLILCSGNQLSPCEFSPQSHFLSLSSSFISNEGIHYWCIIPTQIALSSTSKWWNQACWKHFIRGPKLQCKFMLEWQAEFHLSVWAMVLFQRTRHTARVTIKALIDMQLLH